MIRDEDRKLFIKHAKALDRLVRRIHEYNPEVSLYNTPRRLHLVDGDTHTEGGTPCFNNVVESILVSTLTGGDW